MTGTATAAIPFLDWSTTVFVTKFSSVDTSNTRKEISIAFELLNKNLNKYASRIIDSFILTVFRHKESDESASMFY